MVTFQDTNKMTMNNAFKNFHEHRSKANWPPRMDSKASLMVQSTFQQAWLTWEGGQVRMTLGREGIASRWESPISCNNTKDSLSLETLPWKRSNVSLYCSFFNMLIKVSCAQCVYHFSCNGNPIPSISYVAGHQVTNCVCTCVCWLASYIIMMCVLLSLPQNLKWNTIWEVLQCVFSR